MKLPGNPGSFCLFEKLKINIIEFISNYYE